MLPISAKTKTSTLARTTEILPIESRKIGQFIFHDHERSFLGDWELKLTPDSPDAANLSRAAERLRTSDIPVAFPTETVYGLGADATRSAAVRGIFKAKQRPSDNPLIVHISSLKQLNDLLTPVKSPGSPIPSIYIPLIEKFWPGPLTIIMPLPKPSPFAPEVTATLDTVGVRMPSSLLALALIHLADKPLAAPSANTSSKPSPTTAAHVFDDLSGRVEMIVDGGSCNVGVESTVVDGLCDPPLILRPGAVSLEMIKSCEGWSNVKIGYADGVEHATPRAPGMKYRHYSPQARVVLVQGGLHVETLQRHMSSGQSCGILRTTNWPDVTSLFQERYVKTLVSSNDLELIHDASPTDSLTSSEAQESEVLLGLEDSHETTKVWSLALGRLTSIIARRLFSALRQLDSKGVDVIFVEAIDENIGDAAAAVMNRLRKAAESEVKFTK